MASTGVPVPPAALRFRSRFRSERPAATTMRSPGPERRSSSWPRWRREMRSGGRPAAEPESAREQAPSAPVREPKAVRRAARSRAGSRPWPRIRVWARVWVRVRLPVVDRGTPPRLSPGRVSARRSSGECGRSWWGCARPGRPWWHRDRRKARRPRRPRRPGRPGPSSRTVRLVERSAARPEQRRGSWGPDPGRGPSRWDRRTASEWTRGSAPGRKPGQRLEPRREPDPGSGPQRRHGRERRQGPGPRQGPGRPVEGRQRAERRVRRRRGRPVFPVRSRTDQCGSAERPEPSSAAANRR
ncbi:MAG: hypothetical protein JWL58_3691 [Streptosporangiaceae bacterium]|nr:hypothetical protein [Streptosporangiaceae bacterium]